MIEIELIERRCPICQTHSKSELNSEANLNLSTLDEFAFASRKLPEYMHWRLMECKGCDLLYANPAPSLEQLAKLYKDADFSSRDEARMASKTYGLVLQKFIQQLSDRDSAVDIGTGDGVFLNELLALAFKDVCGIEPSTAPIEMATDEIRPLIRQGIFQQNTFENDSKTLITCFQTIEHLTNPLEFCKDAHRALKPGGAIFLIGHNRRSLSARVLGKKSPIYDIEHMQLFSFESITNLLKSSGFKNIEVGRIYNRYPIRYWIQLFPFPNRLKKAIIRGLDISRLGNIAIPLPAGNMYAVGFK